MDDCKRNPLFSRLPRPHHLWHRFLQLLQGQFDHESPPAFFRTAWSSFISKESQVRSASTISSLVAPSTFKCSQIVSISSQPSSESTATHRFSTASLISTTISSRVSTGGTASLAAPGLRWFTAWWILFTRPQHWAIHWGPATLSNSGFH